MKAIPNRLQCAYCVRYYTHGGECQGKKSMNDESGCLIFKADEKGCIRSKDLKIPVSLYSEIPVLNVWCNDYELNGIETMIRIKRIHHLSWDKQNGYLYIYGDCDYYVNEFHEDYKDPKDKSILKVIK